MVRFGPDKRLRQFKKCNYSASSRSHDGTDPETCMEKVNGNEESELEFAHMCVTPQPPCTLPEQLARSIAKEMLPKTPFVCLAFPFSF